MIALREGHLGQEAERHAAAFAVVQTFLDPARLLDEGHAGFEVAGHEAQHPFDASSRWHARSRRRRPHSARSLHRAPQPSVLHPPETQAAVAHTHHALGCRFGIADALPSS